MDEIHKDPGDLSFRVITPHPGEMATLTGIPLEAIQMERAGVARDAAHKTGVCVVLKGQRTVIASPHGHLWINPTGNPGMAKGGSGDVLAGMMGAFLAARYNGVAGVRSSNDPEGRALNALKKKYQATGNPDVARELEGKMAEKAEQVFTLMAALNACRAVYLHGLAEDIAREIYGESSMVATDIIECIAEAIETCAREAYGKFTYLHR